MTDQPDLDAIRARADAASPGPWERRRYHDSECAADCDKPECFLYVVTTPTGMLGDVKDMEAGEVLYLERTPAEAVADARFIAAARTDVPALLAEVERLRAQLRAEIEQMGADRRGYLETIAAKEARAQHVEAQRQAALDLCESGGDWKGDARYWVPADAVRSVLGEQQDQEGTP